MLRKLLLAVLFAFIAHSAHAVCTPISSLSLVAGGPAVHVSIVDQACNVIAPSPLPNPTNVGFINLINANGFFTIVADATGFNFTGLQALNSGSAAPRYTNGTASITGAPMAIVITSGVTAIQVISP